MCRDGEEGGLLRCGDVLTKSRGSSGETCKEDDIRSASVYSISKTSRTRLVVVQHFDGEVARQSRSDCWVVE